jgi:hypothetical protein
VLQYVVPLESAGSRGVAGSPQGPSSGLGGGEVRGGSLLAVSTGAAGATAVEAGKERPAQGGIKMVPGRSLGCSWCEDVEARASEIGRMPSRAPTRGECAGGPMGAPPAAGHPCCVC